MKPKNGTKMDLETSTTHKAIVGERSNKIPTAQDMSPQSTVEEILAFFPRSIIEKWLRAGLRQWLRTKEKKSLVKTSQQLAKERQKQADKILKTLSEEELLLLLTHCIRYPDGPT